MLKRVLGRDWKTNEERSELLAQLGGFRDLKADELVPLMSTTDNSVRAFAEYQLKERLDPKSIAAILDSLTKKTSRTQSQILNALIRSRPELSIPHVQKLVSDSQSMDLAQRAMEALSGLPVHQVGSEFARFLSHERKDIRHMALVMITQNEALLSDKAIRRTITDMADDDDERIRLKVIDLVVKFNPGDAVRLCLERLKDPSPAVQQSAVRSDGRRAGAHGRVGGGRGPAAGAADRRQRGHSDRRHRDHHEEAGQGPDPQEAAGVQQEPDGLGPRPDAGHPAQLRVRNHPADHPAHVRSR